MPGSARSRYTTFLVARGPGPGEGARGVTVYAAMKRDAEAALAAVRALADTADVAIVGSLSTSTAKAIKLKPEEVRVV